MSLLTAQLLRGLSGLTRRLPVQRVQIHSKPPREELGTMVRSGAGRARDMQRASLGSCGEFGAGGSGALDLGGTESALHLAARSLAGGGSAGLGVSGGRERKGQCPGSSRGSVNPRLSGQILPVTFLSLIRCAASSP